MMAVVVPCYNEEKLIDDFTRGFLDLRRKLKADLVFVNDGSLDRTGEKISVLSAKYGWIKIVTHDANKGLAQSLKDGFSYALNEGYELIGQMDADLTHPPLVLLKMSDAIEGGADLVIASRYVEEGGMKDVPGWRVIISKFGNRIFRLLLRIKTMDATSGFRLARREVIEKISLLEDSFGIQLEYTVKAERSGFNIVEVPFVLTTRKKGSSKFKLRYLFGYIPLTAKLIFMR